MPQCRKVFMPLTQSREVAKPQSFYGFFFAAWRHCGIALITTCQLR
jgi:hypothetical protein